MRNLGKNETAGGKPAASIKAPIMKKVAHFDFQNNPIKKDNVGEEFSPTTTYIKKISTAVDKK